MGEALMEKNSPDIEEYADGEITEYAESTVPRFLKCVYFTLPIWGMVSFYLFWNGSSGWFDRGYWHELQKAAKTTYQQTSNRETSTQP